MNRTEQLAVLVFFMACICCSKAAQTAPPAGWPAELQGILPGQEQNISVAPCIAFRKSTNTSTPDEPAVQCTANPLYLLGRLYQRLKYERANGSAIYYNASLTPAWSNPHIVQLPRNFTLTRPRKALLRLAQKQQYCSQRNKTECIRDMKTPCSWINDDRMAYDMGLAGSNISSDDTMIAQCVYYTQATFTRLLHWEMYQVEQKPPANGTLPAVLNCYWPPYKRQALHCKTSEVDAYCNKTPGCTAVKDSFRFSCESQHALKAWQQAPDYSVTGDDFNATQHIYRMAMRSINLARQLNNNMTDAGVRRYWGDDLTSYFIWAFNGPSRVTYFERAYVNTMGETGEVLRNTSVCGLQATEENCQAQASTRYCSWSREQLLPGLSDAYNPDFPRKACQPSVLARMEHALILSDDYLVTGSFFSHNYDSTVSGTAPDFLISLFSNLYVEGSGGKYSGLCGFNPQCNVNPNITLPFPVWIPKDSVRKSSDSCAGAMQEAWVAE